MKNNIFYRMMNVLLCVVMIAAFAFPVKAADVSGSFQEVSIPVGNTIYNVSAFVFDKKIEKCTSFDLAIDVTMNANTKCKDWGVWTRTNGKYTKVDTLYMAKGEGEASKTVKFETPQNIEAIAILPEASGGYSWTLSISISNITTPSDSVQKPAQDDTTADIIKGDWEQVTLSDDKYEYNISAYVLAEPLVDCVSVDLSAEITMSSGPACKDWLVYVRTDGQFVEVDTLTLPNGENNATKTILFVPAQTFDAIAIIPKDDGEFSWSTGIQVANAIGSASFAANIDDNTVFNTYEGVTINSGSSTYTVYALKSDKSVKACKGFDLVIDATMYANTKCKNWQVWIRCNGKFEKAGNVILEEGGGMGYATITLPTAKEFDAVAVTPAAPGSYSWNMEMGVYNLQF